MRLSNCASHNLQAGNRAAFVSLPRLINQAPIGRGRSPLMVVPAAQVEAPSTTEGSPAKAARFVGTGAKPAAEYHEADFVWQEHAAEVGPAVERQKEETLKARRESHQSASTSQAQTQKETKSLDENEWEVFYRLHPAAKFFKERRWVLTARADTLTTSCGATNTAHHQDAVPRAYAQNDVSAVCMPLRVLSTT